MYKGRILIRILLTCLSLQRTKNDKQERLRVDCFQSPFNKVSLIFRVDQVWLQKVTKMAKSTQGRSHLAFQRRSGLSFLGLKMETLVYKIKLVLARWVTSIEKALDLVGNDLESWLQIKANCNAKPFQFQSCAPSLDLLCTKFNLKESLVREISYCQQ